MGVAMNLVVLVSVFLGHDLSLYVDSLLVSLVMIQDMQSGRQWNNFCMAYYPLTCMATSLSLSLEMTFHRVMVHLFLRHQCIVMDMAMN